MSAIESLLSQLREATSTADLPLRFKLSAELRSLAHSIATPTQTMQHYGYMYTEQLVVKIAADLDLFTILVESEGPLKVEDIASKTGADYSLLDRILRHLAATYTITEVGKSTFAANEATRLLASPPGWGNLMFGFNILNKAYGELPNLLKVTKYQNPDHSSDTSFHRAYNTKLPFFLYLQQDPETLRYFQQSLAAFESPISWTTSVPLMEKLQESDKDAPLFVDIGGGHGSQCAAFRKATAEKFPGRVINQDLPETLASAPKNEDFEMMAQNFFERNQIQGARIYFIRKCLHDLPDRAAKLVLQHIKDAMSPQSLLLIDEIILPAAGASINTMELDFTMMTMFNSMERSLPHWTRLLGEVGLKIANVYKYDPYGEDCILEALRTER